MKYSDYQLKLLASALENIRSATQAEEPPSVEAQTVPEVAVQQPRTVMPSPRVSDRLRDAASRVKSRLLRQAEPETPVEEVKPSSTAAAPRAPAEINRAAERSATASPAVPGSRQYFQTLPWNGPPQSEHTAPSSAIKLQPPSSQVGESAGEYFAKLPFSGSVSTDETQSAAAAAHQAASLPLSEPPQTVQPSPVSDTSEQPGAQRPAGQYFAQLPWQQAMAKQAHQAATAPLNERSQTVQPSPVNSASEHPGAQHPAGQYFAQLPWQQATAAPQAATPPVSDPSQTVQPSRVNSASEYPGAQHPAGQYFAQLPWQQALGQTQQSTTDQTRAQSNDARSHHVVDERQHTEYVDKGASEFFTAANWTGTEIAPVLQVVASQPARPQAASATYFSQIPWRLSADDAAQSPANQQPIADMSAQAFSTMATQSALRYADQDRA